MTNGIAHTLWMVAAAAGLVLLVAWANVSNLMLIRADGRQLELAVREALGASRLRSVTHFLGESLVLTATAGAVALLAAWGAVHALVTFGPTDVPRLAELRTGPMTVACVAVLSVVGAIICAAVPVVRSGARRRRSTFVTEDGATPRKDTAAPASNIAALQIAVALVVPRDRLLLRTFYQLYQERPGFDATNVMTIWTQLPFARYGDSSSVIFYARLSDAVGKLPVVRAAGLTTRLPLGSGESRQQSIRVEGEGRTLSLPTDGGRRIFHNHEDSRNRGTRLSTRRRAARRGCHHQSARRGDHLERSYRQERDRETLGVGAVGTVVHRRRRRR
jgi:hypothetical protein